MAKKRFRLSARIDSDSPSALHPVLMAWFDERGTVRALPGGFEVTGEFEGDDARELNRRLLSELRSRERRTRLRAEWTSGEITQRFFDYVPKGSRAATGSVSDR